MATTRKKARQHISYVLPLADGLTRGHRLGVNSLAIDRTTSRLYSAGRDGVICAWALNFPLDAPAEETSSSDTASTALSPRQTQARNQTVSLKQVQAHTHWVNDIALAHNNAALVSASSDCSVKLWRPTAHDGSGSSPTTIGLHTDYVKALASPSLNSDWIASGGLDRKIRLWDLAGGGEKLVIDAQEEERENDRGSVYALRAVGSLMASGGPEGIVRMWDPRSGKRVTKFVGHTDNVRDILINEAGDIVMTASSDQTIKVWSMAAGRCMHTLTMHDDSVWSLYSNHPNLAVFYSADRSGLIAKTDVTNCADLDEALSVAVAKEHGGVNKFVVGGSYLWTATASSSINRWSDVSTTGGVQVPEPRGHRIRDSTSSRPITNGDSASRVIPTKSVLRTTNAGRFSMSTSRFNDVEGAAVQSGMNGRKASEIFMAVAPDESVAPVHDRPVETVEGQNGLIKHRILSDRRRVLTVDTAGDLTMWDLIKCVPIRSFGKRDLDDTAAELDTQEIVQNWCSLDTRTGRLAVAVEENYAFEAEVYGDELELDEEIEFRDDQRVKYGQWVLRYLFAGLIDEEIKRDEAYRSSLLQKQHTSGMRRMNAPPKLSSLPTLQTPYNGSAGTTPRAVNGSSALTPGLTIGVATPGGLPTSPGSTTYSPLRMVNENGDDFDKRKSMASNNRASGDYFTRSPLSPISNPPGPAQSEAGPQSPSEPEKEGKSGGFRSKIRISLSKRLGRNSAEQSRNGGADEKSESDKSSTKEEPIFEDSFFGVVQSIRYAYDEAIAADPSTDLPMGIRVSMPQETPVIRPPAHTPVSVQEERTDSGGVADIYRGTVETVGRDADAVEKLAPAWLGELLLRNNTPTVDPSKSKTPFLLLPHKDILPSMASPEGSSRLNAPRMLRCKKIITYIAERIRLQMAHVAATEPSDPAEYIEVTCQDKVVPLNMTLATMKQFMWKISGDLVLYYRAKPGAWSALEERFWEEGKGGQAGEVVQQAS